MVAPRPIPTLIATLALALAGCIQLSEPVTPASTTGPVAAGVAPAPELIAHTATGILNAAVAPQWDALRIRVAQTGFGGGEPTLGVLKDGTIFTTVFFEDWAEAGYLVRSRDHGVTWEPVHDPVNEPKLNLDPWIWVDPITDRVFNAPLYVACSWLAYSDDAGETWESNPIAGCGLPAHDHQKLTTGPPPQGVTTDGYPNVAYYAYNGAFRGLAGPDTLHGTWVSVSLDGGKTFNLGTKVHERDCKSGVIGGVAVTPVGTAISAKPTCEGVNIAISRDAGATWKQVASINDVGIQGEEKFRVNNPEVVVDTAGNAYLFYTAADGLGYVSVSKDDAETWTKPVKVTPPGVTHTMYSVAAVGEPGRVAFGYVGTTSDTAKWSENSPQGATDDAVWHLYMTFSENALDPAPTFTSARLTPDDDPVQRGCIWLSGGNSACRNMLDFVDMVQHEGRAYFVYTDGCDKCKTADTSRESDVHLAIVESGPSLLTGALAPLLAASPTAN